MKKLLLSLLILSSSGAIWAQYKVPTEPTDTLKNRPFRHITYKVELQGSASSGKTPLWLNANKYGLSSLDKANGYVRGTIERNIKEDEERKWGLGYGLDVAVPVNYTSNFIVQQAYIEGQWWHGALTIGAKEEPMELKDQQLSSGSQALGINARPIPQVRLSLPDYYTLPFLNGWLHIKGHIAYGMMTDQNWQRSFTHGGNKYTTHTLYHSKAGYLKIGNEEVFSPWSIELGLEMAATFGGTTYMSDGNGGYNQIKNAKGLRAFWDAFIPGGSEVVEQGSVYQNAAGNDLGAWLARVSYQADSWKLSLYADKYFEDHSAMLQLDYNGYGTGGEWNTKKSHRYFLYDFKDWLLGLEYRSLYDRPIMGIVFEYLYSKYQSGPVYHDHTSGWSEHISGRDNFYNHGIYPGWQHWGQVMGNPLYRSPLYNNDGSIYVKDNRFVAFHLGIDGKPANNLYYRLLASYQEGFGTYETPYVHKRHNISFLLESEYSFPESTRGFLHGCSIRGGYGMDFGSILEGTNYGFQLTLSKRGFLKN